MRTIGQGNRRPRIASLAIVFLCVLLRIPIVHAQTSCLVYSFSDPHAPCTSHSPSAVQSLEDLFVCVGPYFCSGSYDTLDSVDYDPQQAGKSFLVTVTYHASPTCGNTNTTGQGWGSITAATGSSCPVPKFYVKANPDPAEQPCNCNASGKRVDAVSDPINPGSGAVFETEEDVVLSGPGGLRFQRFYNSGGTASTDMGAGWRHSYSRNLKIIHGTAKTYVPYPPPDAHSALYSSPADACTAGFLEIRPYVPSWAGATPSWTGSICLVMSGTTVVGVAPVLSTDGTPMLLSDPVTEAQAIRDDGVMLRFTGSGSVLAGPPGSNTRLQQSGSGYELIDADDTVELYDGSGVLQSITTRNGRVQTMAYDSSARLSTVTDSFGNQLTLGYDSQSRLISVNLLNGPPPLSCLRYNYPYSSCNSFGPSAKSAATAVFACLAATFCGNSYDSVVSVNSDPAIAGQNYSITVHYYANGCGGDAQGTATNAILAGSGSQCSGSMAVQYGYDGANRLRSVYYPDMAQRMFAYENATFPSALTGVFDESHARLSTWGYDTHGRAVSAQRAGGADAVTLVYNSPTSVTETDALGAVRTFNYARVGDQYLPVSISGSQCPTCTDGAATTYDSAGFVSSRTDYNGNVSCYQNDPARGLELARLEGMAPGSTCPGDLLSYSVPSGTRQRLTVIQWNATWQEPDLITEANRTTAFSYDASGNVLTKTVTDTASTPNVSRTWTYTYNSFGQVLTIDGPRTDVADVTTIAYYNCTSGPQCGQIQTVTNALNQVTTFNSYNSYGQPLSITEPSGAVVTLAYDARQRVTSRQVGTETTSYGYFPTGLLQTVTLPDSSTVHFAYDGAHRLTSITDGVGNSVTYTLDALGNRTAQKAYDPTSTLRRLHTRVYNALSELYKDVNSAGTTAVTTVFAYDGNGNPTSAAAPLSRTTGSAYDELNRLRQITDPASGVTQLSYNTDDGVTAVTDPRSLTTSYSYNGFRELISQLSPDSGTTTDTYNSAGNLSVSTDARGAVSAYTYDALNRVSSATYSLGGTADQVISFTYDAGTYGAGHLTGAADANHSMGWTYDVQGRVTAKSQALGSLSQNLSYGYTNGNLTTLVTPSGQTVSYGYNANHQVTSITVNGTTVLNSVTYDPFGPVTGWHWGNGTTTSRTYDQDGKITQISSNGLKTYSYDNAFRITGLTDTSSGSSNWTYGYDSLDRITSAGSSTVTRGWSYDANGNRLSETGSAPSTYAISSTSNQISGITGTLARTYSYDAAGNTLMYSTVTASYNDRGRLQTLTNGSNTASYIYNALGQLIQSSGTSGTEEYAYDEAGHLIGESDGSGNLIEETVWLGDIPVATVQPNGSGGVNIFYVHTDNLNTPRQVTRPADNAQMWTWFSDAFGTDAANGNPAGAGPFTYRPRFPGQIFLSPAGLHINGVRDYDPALGHYVESDPIGLAGGSLSPYTYANGNPISYIDPTGLLCFDFNKFADEIRDNRFDLGATLGTLGTTLGIGTMPKVPSELRAFGIPQSEINPITSQLSRWAGRFDLPWLRQIGRTTAGIAASTAATAATVFEGFYDLSIEAQAAIHATSSSDCGCQH